MKKWSPEKFIILGTAVLLFMLGGFVAWSFTVGIDGALIAEGRITSEQKNQVIQHPLGGLVTKIHVSDGDIIKAGQEILTLDGTELIASRTQSLRELSETMARIDRLRAETLAHPQVTYRKSLKILQPRIPTLKKTLSEELSLFEARKKTLIQTQSQLKERKVQTNWMITGQLGQIKSIQKRLKIILTDLEVQAQLKLKGLSLAANVSALQHETIQLEGEIGRLKADIAEARSSIAGYELEGLYRLASFREEALSELRGLQVVESQLIEDTRLLETKIKRLVLRAPLSGTVLGLKSHTIGGVIPPLKEVASIVPLGTDYRVSVKVSPGQIDRIKKEQIAKIRLKNFNSNLTPELSARVAKISPDTLIDEQTDEMYYLIELKIQPTSLNLGKKYKLIPGMIVDTIITTDKRTPASFLLKPLSDYWEYALRDR